MISVRFVGQALLNSAYLTGSGQNNAKLIEQTLFSSLKLSDYSQRIVQVSLALSQQTFTGRYSTLFNLIARSNLTPEFLENLPFWSLEDFWPEVYSNDQLSSVELADLKEKHQLEYASLSAAFQKALSLDSFKFFAVTAAPAVGATEEDDLYLTCYNQLCLVQKLSSGKSLTEAETCKDIPMEFQLILDKAPTEIPFNYTYCLPTRDLLISILTDHVNPLSNKKFSDRTIRQIKRNYPVELKLLQFGLS